jgi:hypothetical protein
MRNLGLSAVWRLDMRHKLSLAFVAAFAVFPLESAIAQVGESGYSLPLELAVKAATKGSQPAQATVIQFPPLSLTPPESSSSRPLVGALILARAVDDAELSNEILAAARAWSGEPSRQA